MSKRQWTGVIAMAGLSLVLLSMTSRYFDLLPLRERSSVMIIGFTLMFLGTIWRVVQEMNASDEDN